MGGSNDPSNLIEMTIEEHAEAHRTLFEQNGRWQDFIAWQGLLGRMTKEEMVRESSKRANTGNKYCVGRKYSEETIEKFREIRKNKRHSSKLTKEDVIYIKKQYYDKVNLEEQHKIGTVGRHGRLFGYTSIFCHEYGRKFNVTSACIRKIIKNETWKDGVEDVRSK